MRPPDLHLIGSGRLAHSLALAWRKAGGKVATVWSRNAASGQHLAELSGASWLEQLEAPRSGWLMLAVKDEAVEEISQQLLPQADLLVLHASGTLPLAALSRHANSGVMWPLQSMQMAGNDWSAIPLFIEGATASANQQLHDIAGLLSPKLHTVNSQQRLYYHLAAVMAGNFSNALYQQVYELLSSRGLDPTVLLPQLQAGLQGLMEQPPAHRQTGPAVRKDVKVMEQHLALLSDQPELASLYALFSKMIQKQADSLRSK